MIIADVIYNEPVIGDRIFIECGDTLIETDITDITDDGIIINLDESAMRLLIDKRKKFVNESSQDSVRYDDFMKRNDELHDAIIAARKSGDTELAKKLQREYDALHAKAERGLLPEGVWNRIKSIIPKMPNMQDIAATNSLTSLGYLIGIAAQDAETGSGLRFLENIFTPDELKTFVRAVHYANDSDPIKRNNALLKGIQRAKTDFVEMEESELTGFAKRAYKNMTMGMNFLQMDLNAPVNSAQSNINKSTELSEGLSRKIGTATIAGLIGAGAALSPSAYVNGVQYYYSETPPSSTVQTKKVVDDSGRQILVWTATRRGKQEKYYYDPKSRAVKESRLQFNSVELHESQIAQYVKHYYSAYSIDRASLKSISNFKKNNRLIESSDSELSTFISAIANTDTVKRIAVGDKFAVLAFEIFPAWKEIDVYGFAEPKEISRIVKHSDGRINFIEFTDGDRYPRITQATHNAKPFMQTAYFNSADAVKHALTAITLAKPESYSINFSEYGTAHKLDEAEYRGRKVSLGKPFLTPDGPKKRSVYVKNPKGNVVKVNFGQKGVKIKKSNPARRKSFRARHNCANPGPRHRARYWSCRFW